MSLVCWTHGCIETQRDLQDTSCKSAPHKLRKSRPPEKKKNKDKSSLTIFRLVIILSLSIIENISLFVLHNEWHMQAVPDRASLNPDLQTIQKQTTCHITKQTQQGCRSILTFKSDDLIEFAQTLGGSFSIAHI